MSPLRNTRREKFCLALAEGKSAHEAYTLAGYKPCRQNAARLMTFDDIKARVAEIQAENAKKSEVTVQSLLNELEDARCQAMTKDQMAAACKAIMGKAQLAGAHRSK
jgi:phage terminase small subunit